MTFLSVLSAWAPVGLWAGLIYYLSSIPSLSSGLGVWDVFLRKGAHIFEFAVLAGLLIRAFSRSCVTITKKTLLLTSGLLSFLYAASDEFHQSFVPGRGPSVLDVLVDSIGIGLALFIYHKYSTVKA